MMWKAPIVALSAVALLGCNPPDCPEVSGTRTVPTSPQPTPRPYTRRYPVIYGESMVHPLAVNVLVQHWDQRTAQVVWPDWKQKALLVRGKFLHRKASGVVTWSIWCKETEDSPRQQVFPDPRFGEKQEYDSFERIVMMTHTTPSGRLYSCEVYVTDNLPGVPQVWIDVIAYGVVNDESTP